MAMLALANASAFVAMPLVIFIASLVGSELIENQAYVTLPVAATVVGVAAGVWPVSQLNGHFGRKITSLIFLGIGFAACLIASAAVAIQSFVLFCLANFLIGMAVAAVQQFRYAAIECMGAEKAPTAASIILAGGIFAAFAGPELAIIGRDLTAISWQGSFWLASIAFVISMGFILFFRPVAVSVSHDDPVARPLAQMINPDFVLAIVAGASSYAVMSFIMTATPISMHHHFMHSLEATKFVIQSHIAAMFLPSLVAPFLFRRFGIPGMIKLGLLAFGGTLLVGYQFTSVAGFWVQLVLLGIGWNFLFVAGTSLLPQTYEPSDRLKAQAVDDGLVFSMQAVSSIFAGILMVHISWAALISFALLPVGLTLISLSWYAKSQKAIAL